MQLSCCEQLWIVFAAVEMAVQFQEDIALQYSLRIGDTVLLYAKETYGYVCSELSSSRHNSLYLYKVDSLKDPNLPNVHFATFKVVAANKYKAQQTLSRLKKKIEKKHEPSTFDKGELLKAEKALKFELNENQTEQERLQGSNIVYGEKVQLLHTLTKKYLCVNKTKTSRTENTNLRVELSEENAEGCIFKILPRYKVRSVGDEVRYNDQVKFESFKTEGQFLHCSARRFRSRFKVLENRHELNLSATESSLTIIPHYRPMADHKRKAFRAGATVRLFHREREYYVSAEGSFADSPAVIEDVHCRKRHTDHGKMKKPSTSANVYWQFEKERDPRSGEPLSWGERCRIKHLPTRCYLAVVQEPGGKFNVTLKECNPYCSQVGSTRDLDTVFSLSPLIQEEDTIEVESYARIKHLQTRTWLHMEKTEEYLRVAFNPEEPGLQGLEWDNAELYKLTATETMNYDDAFTLEQVSEELLDKFNYVAGIVPVLTTHINTDSPVLNPRSAYLISSALNDLSKFMSTPDERENKNRQKLLRNLRVLELVIKVLEPFKPTVEDEKEQRMVCQACYGVIKSYLNGDSRKNENYLARFVHFFKTQVRMGLNAEEVMIEMVEDNSAIVSKMAETEIEYMIQQLVETMDSRFMDFLGNLCVCAGRPIPSTQNTVLKKLVEEHGEEVFYITDIGGSRRCPGGQTSVVYFKDPKAASWKPLADIASKEDEEKSEQCEFLERQLSLFARLCQGNNATTIYALGTGMELVTFDEALSCSSSDQLCPSLRSKYVELMTVMYVDIGENRDVLENLSYSFIYKDVFENPYADTGGEGGDTVALTGVENKHFPAMREWICTHLRNAAEHKVVADEMEENILLAAVIEVLKLFVKYSYYDDPNDVNAVLNPLIDLLNGFSDVPFKTTKEGEDQKLQDEFSKNGGRYAETENNKPIFDIKKRAIEVIDLFFNFRFYVRLQRFIYDFRILKGDTESGSTEGSQRELDCINGMAGGAPPLPELLPPLKDVRPPSDLNILQYHSGIELVDNEIVVQMVRVRLEYLFAQSAYEFEKQDHEPSLPRILLDVANYKEDDLIQESFHLLSRYFSTEITLFEKAIQTQLLVTDESEKVFKEVGELLPDLRRYLSIEVKEKGRAEIVRILKRFTEICCLDEDEQEPHPQNQKILYNYGVLSDVLNYVLQTSKSLSMVGASDEGKDEVKTKGSSQRKTRPGRSASSHESDSVFEECYKFLKALAKNNIDVQRRLYNRMDDLLEVEVAVPHMAEVLTEVFTGSLELCLEVKEEQIERLFQMITRLDQEGIPELTTTLQAMTKVEELDIPPKKNQEYITKFFSKTREKFCDHILGEGKDKEAKRWSLLIDGDSDDPDLHLLLTMTDLLAACAEGENLFIESVCQTIFTVQELLKILNCPFLLPERKRPFARFLVYVYMSTASDKYSSGASMLDTSSVMWEYLERLGIFLENMGQVLKTIPPSESRLVREGLSSVSRRYSSSKKRKSKSPRTQSMSTQFITREDGKLLPGVLVYLSDGVLPLLKAYYQLFFNLSSDKTERIKQLNITSHILSGLLYLCGHLAENFTLDSQVKLYRGTVLTIMKEGGGELPLQVEDEVMQAFELKTKLGVAKVTAAKAVFQDTYRTEVELNKTFHKFVTAYQQVYEGPNTASAQIRPKYSNQYMYSTPYSTGDESLPLGPSFQKQVALFVKNSPGSQWVLVEPCTERLLTQLEISFSSDNDDLSESERSKQDTLDIRCLQIMRTIIHNEVMQIDPKLKEQSSCDYRKMCISRLHPIQNTIQDFGNAVSRVVPLLSHSNDEIVREVLAFMKAMLYSGNRHVQEGMEYVLETREERLFTAMQSLLQHAATTFSEKNSLLAQIKAREATERELFGDSDTIISMARGREASLAKEDEAVMDTGVQPQVAIELESSIISPQDSLQHSAIVGAYNGDPEDSIQVHVHRGHNKMSLLRGQGKASKGEKKEFQDVFEMGTLLREESKEKQTSSTHADDLLPFKDTHHVKLALKVIGLMCDGQFRVMQNYLREQRDNIISVNVVGEVALFIQHFYQDINAETMELVHLILQTLIEMCVGNYPNQLVIFNRQILEALNQIFQLDISNASKRNKDIIENSVNLKGSAIELLEAMLERTDPKTKDLVEKIAGGLNIENLHNTLTQFSTLRGFQRNGSDDEALAEQGMFRTFHVLVHLMDYGVPAKKLEPKERSDQEPKEDEHDENLRKVWQFCKKQSKSVEVFYRNMKGEKILTKVHFPCNPDNELRHEVIENIKWKINRDSPEDKLRDLLEWIKAVKRDTAHCKRLHNFRSAKILTAFPLQRHQLLLFWTFLMNLFVIMSFAIPEDRRKGFMVGEAPGRVTFLNASRAVRPDFLAYWRGAYPIVLYVFGAIHVIMSLWMVVEYFVVNWPNFRLPGFYYSIMSHWKKVPEETYSDVPIFGLRTMYTVVFLLCSILSLPSYGYLYCICLLHIIINNDILQRVLRSITKNGKSLLWVAVLGFIVLFIYAVVSFAFLHESFLAADNDNGDLFCSTLYECYVSVVRYGLIDNLGLIVPLVPHQFGVAALRLLYDVSFFIIITTIGLNIVFGIIVDTFSELRDERYRTEEDKKAVCFICSIPSHEFERRASGFDDHVKCDHNMWNYIYYSIYLDQIDISDHNAIESYVYGMIQSGKIEFFPLLKALVLEKKEDETAQRLQELKEMVTNVLQRFREEEHEKSRQTKRQEQKKWEEENFQSDNMPRFGSIDARSSIDVSMFHGRPSLYGFRQPSTDMRPPSDSADVHQQLPRMDST